MRISLQFLRRMSYLVFLKLLKNINVAMKNKLKKKTNKRNCYLNNFLSPYLCGYRKGLRTQLALLSLTEKQRKVLDNKSFRGAGRAVLMHLSKAFDTVNHDLLIAKQRLT